MTIYRVDAKRDSNEPEIVEALQRLGFSVDRVSAKGFPDLVVARYGRMWLLEVKRPKGRFTAAQVLWRQRWHGPVPFVVRSVDDAIAWAQAGDRQSREAA
jgi:protein-disulfide isomerase-like protein with CxxC motif